jgi:hypothetical protein
MDSEATTGVILRRVLDRLREREICVLSADAGHFGPKTNLLIRGIRRQVLNFIWVKVGGTDLPCLLAPPRNVALLVYNWQRLTGQPLPHFTDMLSELALAFGDRMILSSRPGVEAEILDARSGRKMGSYRNRLNAIAAYFRITTGREFGPVWLDAWLNLKSSTLWAPDQTKGMP